MLTSGEKGILFILKDSNSKMSKLRLVKLMFLISKRLPLYYFIPYKYGPFSFQLYHDLSRLEKDGFVSIDDNSVCLVKTDLPSIDPKIKNIIRMNSERFSTFDDKMLLDYIYEENPEYTIFSQYRKKMDYDRNSSGIVTIGYEGKTIDKFLYELIRNKIGVVADVRKNAYSMKFGFQRNKLESYLEKIGIDYIHMHELGIPSDSRKNLNTYEDYQALFADYRLEIETKMDYLERIKSISQNKKVSLMCFEKDVRYCHRGVIAKRLREIGVEVIDL
ncbi:Uncharacterised protein [uncultured archaeon]|nr:Uncharacterised protein [uncultured archaeon]